MRTTFIAVALSVVMLLTGCFGGSGEEVDPTQSKYTGDGFSLIYPKDWEILEKSDFPSGLPTQTELAIRNNIKDKGFIANVTIVKNPLASPISSLEYGRKVYAEHRARIVNFNLENREQITTPIGDQNVETLYVVFAGKLDPTRDTLRFIQKFATTEDTAYIVTISTGLNESDLVMEKAKNVMRSFKVD